jgi:flavodoxin
MRRIDRDPFWIIVSGSWVKEEDHMAGRTLILVYSYHNHNTDKVAMALSRVLDASVMRPSDVDPRELLKFDLVGFGSGIYGAKHHKEVLGLVDRIPEVSGNKAFIFSTDGAPRSLMKDAQSLGKKMREDHSELRDRLLSKGFAVIGEFNCPGLNTNVFLKFFGGINKGRPNKDDLEKAEGFARNLLKD